jgi:hypothetical protein
MTREQINIQAMNTLSKMSIERLLEQWELVSKMEVTQEVVTTRGWILDALTMKNPEAMDEYLDGFYDDSELKRFLI